MAYLAYVNLFGLNRKVIINGNKYLLRDLFVRIGLVFNECYAI